MVTDRYFFCMSLSQLYDFIDSNHAELECERPGRYLWIKFRGAKPRGKARSTSIGFMGRDLMCVDLVRDANSHVSLITFERIATASSDPDATSTVRWEVLYELLVRRYYNMHGITVMLDTDEGTIVGKYYTCSEDTVTVRGLLPPDCGDNMRTPATIMSITIEHNSIVRRANLPRNHVPV